MSDFANMLERGFCNSVIRQTLGNSARDTKVNDRDLAILRGRDDHDYDWDVANRYADGWYAAHVG